ncbi:MAG: type IV toxin-antitoxin system AbiEi family antitoxin [Alphaproteobacteria bacterium]|nr:type IV toxin-antitoxin system AbiEi family antitoxin [Alphaproteobacteria bacterium]
MKYNYLSDYLMTLLSKGELIFSKASAIRQLEKTDAAIRNSIKRQVALKQIVPLFRGHYLIIPPEYKQLGFVPPELFIDDLMRAINFPYYISLLSAASFYGATHQATQVLQVMVTTRLKPVILGRTRIVFYFNKNLTNTPLQHLKTDRGPLNVSTPEATAFDLLRYVHQSGNLNQVATVLDELIDRISCDILKETAMKFPLVYAQRLGYLFEYLGHQELAAALAHYVKEHKPVIFSLLRPGKNATNAEKNDKWHLIINESIEPDL